MIQKFFHIIGATVHLMVWLVLIAGAILLTGAVVEACALTLQSLGRGQ